jgi:hypothetical protein
MAGPSNASPSRRATVLWILLILAVIGGIWYFFLGPGVGQPWPWEGLLQHFKDRSTR